MIPSNIWFGGIKTCWAQKITQEKSTKFIKTFELYKFFVPNCSDIPNVFINIETFWAQKTTPEKFTKFTKILNYVKSSGIMFCAEMLGCSGYIFLARRINTFWLKGFDKLWSGVIETIWAQTIKKKSAKFRKIFELYRVFMCPKIFQYLQIIYWRCTLKTFLPLLATLGTTLPQLCQLFTASQLYAGFYQ